VGNLSESKSEFCWLLSPFLGILLRLVSLTIFEISETGMFWGSSRGWPAH
jgi:hypothetical protein